MAARRHEIGILTLVDEGEFAQLYAVRCVAVPPVSRDSADMTFVHLHDAACRVSDEMVVVEIIILERHGGQVIQPHGGNAPIGHDTW